MGLIREEEEIRNLKNLEAKLREENLKLAQERQVIAAQVREQKREKLVSLGINAIIIVIIIITSYNYYYYIFHRKTIRSRFTTTRNATSRNGKELEQEEDENRKATIRAKSDRN